jgi:hypothetical protein
MAKWAGLVALVLLLVPRASAAGSVTVRFEGGYVTVSATNAAVRDVLAEWARQGHTRFVNAEKVPGGAVTLELVHVPEKQALEVLLRAASGYLAAPRTSMAGGLSVFDRIVVMPTSSAPPPAPGGARLPVRPPVFPQPPPVAVDDQEEPPGFNPGGPPVLNDMPEDPDEQAPTSPQVPQPLPFMQGQQEGVQPAIIDPNAPATAPTPVVPGPTPALPGMLTQPMPGQMPMPAQKPPQ